MTVRLRWEQCCTTPGCKKPAHYGELCAACFFASSPARRAAELLTDELRAQPEPAAEPVAGPVFVSDEGAAWLKQVWAA